MCGRYTLSTPADVIQSVFDLGEALEWEPRYNIAPTQLVPAVVAAESGARVPRIMHWGLIPSWADGPAIGNRMINARAETAPEKPAFRGAFKSRRCLLPADGFYEWQKLEKRKQPHCIRLKSGAVFAFAGLWDRWKSPEGEVVESCTILTTDANDVVRALHDRMPVILAAGDYALWLDPKAKPELLKTLLRPFDAEPMEAYPVSTVVNSPRNETPECIKPVTDGG